MKKLFFIIALGIVLATVVAYLFIPPNMTLEKYRNIAVILGVIVALIVYITNSIFQYKQRISANAIRYMELHNKIFKNEFLKNNIQAMEDGNFVRNSEDEKDFNRLLGEIEHLAFLTKTGVVSKSINVYMFGWFACHIQPVLKDKERNNVYWEMAVEFLDELKNDAEDFYKKTKEERQKYFSKNHFFH